MMFSINEWINSTVAECEARLGLPLNNLFNTQFMYANTGYDSYSKFLKDYEYYHRITGIDLDDYINTRTTFHTFQEMYRDAYEQKYLQS